MKNRAAGLIAYFLLIITFSLSHGCPTGYIGSPCRLRRCDFPYVPRNGYIAGGSCTRHYLSVCVMRCNVGYEARFGSAERQCILDQSRDIMLWSGKPMSCVEIRCPLHVLQVQNADPPTGMCTTIDPVYNTRCTFKCLRGYRLKGSNERACQLDKTWSGVRTICEPILCPRLPPVQAGERLSPAMCATQKMRVDRFCSLICPDGFTFQDSIRIWYIICQANGKWDQNLPTCRDIQRPALKCPYQLKASTSKGKATGRVVWSVQVSDNSVDVDPNAVIVVRSSHESGQELPIGYTDIQVNATDQAGNVATCAWRAEVEDTEPPSCSFCPGDIVREETASQVIITWKPPNCSDNSGRKPHIVANRQSGNMFAVPGSYLVQYRVSDGNNDYNDCSFRITLKVKSCPRFAPPRNGALACTSEPHKLCVVLCKNGTDFEFNPPLLYFCSQGKWDSFWLHQSKAPWPNCSGQAKPSWIKTNSLVANYFYYTGDASKPNVKEDIKGKVHSMITSNFVPPFFCKFNPQCTKDSISVLVGIMGKY